MPPFVDSITSRLLLVLFFFRRWFQWDSAESRLSRRSLHFGAASFTLGSEFVGMTADRVEIEHAKVKMAKWLTDRRLADDLFGVPSSQTLSERFFEVAKRAGFGMGIAKADEGVTAVWTHPRIRGADIPRARAATGVEDARVLACAALLKEGKTRRMLLGRKPAKDTRHATRALVTPKRRTELA